MTAFPIAVFSCPEIMVEYEEYLRLPADFRKNVRFRPCQLAVQEWHGKTCELLGRAVKYGYAAIRFPWHGRYDYEVVKNEWVIDQ